jgi:hypothetical protein
MTLSFDYLFNPTLCGSWLLAIGAIFRLDGDWTMSASALWQALALIRFLE